jgi:hypothetical protein
MFSHEKLKTKKAITYLHFLARQEEDSRPNQAGQSTLGPEQGMNTAQTAHVVNQIF